MVGQKSDGTYSLECHKAIIVTESDGGFVDVQNPNNVDPKLMVRGEYGATQNSRKAALDLRTWKSILEPKTVTQFIIHFDGPPHHSSLGKVILKANGQLSIYGRRSLIHQG